MKQTINPKEGLIIIPVKLYGHDCDTVANLALDIGATFSLINWHIAQLLGYDPAVVRNRLRITTGSGVEYVPQIRIKKIETLNRSLINFPVICHTLPTSANVDGLLGLDFFRKTRLLIDLIDGYVNIVKQ